MFLKQRERDTLEIPWNVTRMKYEEAYTYQKTGRIVQKTAETDREAALE